MQGSNKIGNTAKSSVVSHNFKVWDQETNKEIDNLYICDSSIFPTSIGANPMQSIYTFAKLFIDRHIQESQSYLNNLEIAFFVHYSSTLSNANLD